MRFRCERPAHMTAAAVVVFVSKLVGRGASLQTHSWYPKRCCGDGDCFVATRVERLPDGNIQLSNGKYTFRIVPDFPIEQSPDGLFHFCIAPNGYDYDARCVFMPPTS